MPELTDVYFKKDGQNLTRIAFRYKPSGSKVYSPSDEYSSGLLDKVLVLKRDILGKNSEIEKKIFHPFIEPDNRLNRWYDTKEFEVNESFSIFSEIMGCTFDIINKKRGNNMHASFSVIPPNKDYSIDMIYLYVNGKKIPSLPYDLEYTETMIRKHILSASPQEVAEKV